jgi:thiosulfate dehydrogenase
MNACVSAGLGDVSCSSLDIFIDWTDHYFNFIRMTTVLQHTILCVIFFLPGLIIAQGDHAPEDSLAYGLLIPASATMQRAWDIPRNPLSDTTYKDSDTREQILFGFKVFTNPSYETAFISGNSLSCNNCHLNAGQREKALPLVGISEAYPEFNRRAGRLITIEDRIIECFKRSMDASRPEKALHDTAVNDNSMDRMRQSKEVRAIVAYLGWLSNGIQKGRKISWRGQNSVPQEKYIPPDRMDTARGHLLYTEKCVSCHREDGEGVFIGDKKTGPLWGEESWNDGAGAARVYTLAGILRYTMPYLDPGSLTDEEAQNIAAYINSKPRPVYPFKAQDYPGTLPPQDAVYYLRNRQK